ncbi:A-kinase anchor protein 13-like [Megalops cyprinoides]|uniref:A-kinase anchor protein 13-like n=1 Tax=Megalops cyprinoides TaxID=118141 RepID=UPI001864CE37|nr:A-kinase anchor protein 13-like [Megalops cyprinoides]
MKLTPQQAPLYGECVLTVQLCDEDSFEDEEDVEFYLLLSGSTQRHVTSTARISHAKLQAICPAHDCCEWVQATLCWARPGQPVAMVGAEQFRFVQDLAFDMAQFLVSVAGQEDGLEGAMLLDECQVPLQEWERLDMGLALALRHLPLPQGWHLLGAENGDPVPQETLLHFAARRGLWRVALFLLDQPGAREALALPNKQGATPASVAEKRGHSKLQQLLTQGKGMLEGTDTPWQMRSGGHVVRHHPRLDTYTLTTGTEPGCAPPRLQEEERSTVQPRSETRRRPETLTARGSLGQAEHGCPLPAGPGSPPSTCPEQHREESAGGQGKEGDPPHPPDSSQPPHNHGNGTEERVLLRENRGGDYEVREEEEAWPAAACAGDSGRESEPSSCEQSQAAQQSSAPGRLPCGKQEETDTQQAGSEETEEHRQEEERGTEQTEEGTRAQTADKALSLSDSPLLPDMGLTQSQETPLSETQGQGTGGGERENGGVEERSCAVDEAEDGEEGSECWSPPSPPEEEPQSGTRGLGESEETAAGEREGEREYSDCERSSQTESEPELSASPKTGPGSTRREPPQGEGALECPRLVEQEGALQVPIPTAPALEPLPVETDCTAHPTADTPPQESPDGAPDTAPECEERPSTEDDVTSSALPGDGDEGYDVSREKKEDSLQAATDEAFHLPEVGSETGVSTETVELEGGPLGKEEAGKLSELADSQHPLGGDGELSDVQREAGEETVPNPQLPSNQDTAELSPEGEGEDPITTGAADLPCPQGLALTLQSVEEECEEEEERKRTSCESLHSTPEGGAVSLSVGDMEASQTGPSPDLETDIGDATKIQREKDSVVCCDPSTATPGERRESADSSESPVCPGSPGAGSCVSASQQDSCSDGDGLFSADTGDDSIFRRVYESVTGDSTSEVSISCSSTDDTTSVGPPGSAHHSCTGSQRSWSSEEVQQPGGGAGGEAEEEKDRVTEVLVRSAASRSSDQSLSPFRRHSWGPGKNPEGEAEIGPRRSVLPLVLRQHRQHPDHTHITHVPHSCHPQATPTLLTQTTPTMLTQTTPTMLTQTTPTLLTQTTPTTLTQTTPTLLTQTTPTMLTQTTPTMLTQTTPTYSTALSSSMLTFLHYSLEGLTANRDAVKLSLQQGALPPDPRSEESEERGSLVSLTEEDLESDLGECSSLDSQKSGGHRIPRYIRGSMTLPLTKSVSLLAINQRDLDGMRSFSSVSASLAYSISEEGQGPLRADVEGKSGTKVGRTFSYLRSKMYKKTKEKDKMRSKEREAKERESRTVNGHLFSAVNSAPSVHCLQCSKAIGNKEAAFCTNCNAHVHKSCREALPVCTSIRLKTQLYVEPDTASLPGINLKGKSTSSWERPWSVLLAADDPSLALGIRRHTGIMPFNSSNLSKSISISNIAGPVFDEIPLKGLRYLSQSTDSLHKISKVNESTESLTDEGTEMMDSQLLGEFEADSRELEADSWSITVDKKYLRHLKKDVIKRQDVIYELIQTEMHHVRTLRIMADVYSKGLLKEVQLEPQTVERVFPMLDELLDIHTGLLASLLDRKRESQQEGGEGGFIIHRIGDILIAQFSDSSAERMKKVYGKFCSRHNEAVNFYKELYAKDKRFQAFIKKKMSSALVRRLGIPECILLVTQRITKYPVLLQRILQYTKESEEDHTGVAEALRLVKDVIAAVDSKVNEHEKKRRLKEVYSRTDSKSIMRMKSGQMFAREDLLRGRRLLHDGPLQLKSSTGRLKDVQALLLSDVFVFLQEKDQKYVFASLDHRSTVISLKKLIVREVANEERGLFLITAGMEQPEMVEVHAGSKEERNTWIQLLQEAMHSMDKEEDEGIPSESEEDKRLLEVKAKEMRDMLCKKDQQIVSLLEEKLKVFWDMCEGRGHEDGQPSGRVLFRANTEDAARGEQAMREALKEVETLQVLVNGSLGAVLGQQVYMPLESGGTAGSVWAPRRAETFSCFDGHQIHISKNGGRDQVEGSPDLRRTESDGLLKKGGATNPLLLLRRNSEQVLHSISHLHELLSTLQAVVVQQDTVLEEQGQALSDRPASRPSPRATSLIEQEKQRSLEKQRQEAANLQRQQAAHATERRRREREWEARDQALSDREAWLHLLEEETQCGHTQLEAERQELQTQKEEYQRDLEKLRDSQRKLQRDREQVCQELEARLAAVSEKSSSRLPSSASEDSLQSQSPGDCMLSSSPLKDSLSRIGSKRKGKNLNPFASNPSKGQSREGQGQLSSRLLQLGKTKGKKEKRKKKGKGQNSEPAESSLLPVSEQPADGEILFC